MLNKIVPPLCLFLALALAITGFSLLAFGTPEESLSLYQARADGDELTTETLENDLERRQFSRGLFITGLFVGSGVMTVLAFGSMGGRK